MPDQASYVDDRTETEYISYIFDDEMVDDLIEMEEEEEITPTFYMSDKKDNQFIDIDYTEREKQILNNYYDRNLTPEDLKELIDDFTLVTITGERPLDVAIEKTNSAELSEIMVIKEEGIAYDTSELEYLIENEDWLDNDSLRFTPGSSPALIYILPEIDFQSIVVEFYSVVENTYRTERKAIE